jgi:hypothetical protein
VQYHLAGNPWQRLHEEVGCAHPGLDRAEGVLDRFAPLAHLLRMLVKPALSRLENMPMLPSSEGLLQSIAGLTETSEAFDSATTGAPI